MKNWDFLKFWHDFCHWKRWTACRNAWQATVRWKGWSKLFFLPLRILAPLFLLCGAALIWVFLKGFERQVWVYGLYVASAYTLMNFCIRIPAAIRQEGSWRDKYPRVNSFLKNEELHFRLELYRQRIAAEVLQLTEELLKK